MALRWGKYQYRAQKQRVPILIGKRQDFMVKIKVLPLAAEGEVVENQMGQIHPVFTTETRRGPEQDKKEIN